MCSIRHLHAVPGVHAGSHLNDGHSKRPNVAFGTNFLLRVEDQDKTSQMTRVMQCATRPRSYPTCSTTSGAIQNGEPCSGASPGILASALVRETEAPKSPIFTMPLGAMKMLPPLMSLKERVTDARFGHSQLSKDKHHTSHVTRHTSHVTRHTSHVTRHTPPVNDPILMQKLQPLQDLPRVILNNRLRKRTKHAEGFRNRASRAEFHQDGKRL
jgi:hypothetical protein